jgi:Uma2 family endonuclease
LNWRSLIAAGLISLCFSHLQDSHCETGTSDLKIKVAGSHKYTYPDVVVTCDERDKGSTQFVTYPCLIIEVLSKSTEAYDRGGKFRLYQQNPVLQDYLLVSSTSIEMDLYHKNNAGEWLIKNYQAGDTVELKSINLSFLIEQVYRGLTFETE